jgi:hypothetical protein
VTARHLPLRELDASVVVAMPTSRVRIDFVRNERVPFDSTFISKRWRPIFDVQLVGERVT